jgi:actin-related protein
MIWSTAQYSGVHELVKESLSKSLLDMRSELLSNIVLSGGSTLTLGYGQRMINEVVKFSHKDTKTKIHSHKGAFGQFIQTVLVKLTCGIENIKEMS